MAGILFLIAFALAVMWGVGRLFPTPPKPPIKPPQPRDKHGHFTKRDR